MPVLVYIVIKISLDLYLSRPNNNILLFKKNIFIRLIN